MTARKPPVDETPVDETPAVDRPKLTVADLQDVLVELLDHATLRDAKELPRLRSRLTGEEVPDADEESAAEGSSEG
jgi:hypothetical protein